MQGTKFPIPNLDVGGIPNLIHGNFFSLDVPLITPDKARQVL